MKTYSVYIVIAHGSGSKAKILTVNTLEQAENMLYEVFRARRARDKICLLQGNNGALLINAGKVEYADIELDF
jgi:hypothetical protein